MIERGSACIYPMLGCPLRANIYFFYTVSDYVALSSFDYDADYTRPQFGAPAPRPVVAIQQGLGQVQRVLFSFGSSHF